MEIGGIRWNLGVVLVIGDVFSVCGQKNGKIGLFV